MMLRLILVTCMTSSVLSHPLHQLFRRSLVKRYGNEDYEYLVNLLANRMVNNYGGDPLTEQEIETQLLAHGLNEDTAKHLSESFVWCCDDDSDNLLNRQELRRAMHEFSPFIYP
ncbi:uncharacterized protein LOC132562753 [Ylistrum balloti]|uniref:uncharacterized protein LOC132562753 n=1 Tax=Ylistrum balloti TaxID=509963 RepID=UPI002905BF73|nr:uncharacterized protein LOC132562753 [Ylistrum balloti]